VISGDPFPAVAEGPPSTGTTEYVAFLTNGCNQAASRGMNGIAQPKVRSKLAANSAGVERLRRMAMMRN